MENEEQSLAREPDTLCAGQGTCLSFLRSVAARSAPPGLRYRVFQVTLCQVRCVEGGTEQKLLGELTPRATFSEVSVLAFSFRMGMKFAQDPEPSCKSNAP